MTIRCAYLTVLIVAGAVACTCPPAPLELRDAVPCVPPSTTTIAGPHDLPAVTCRERGATMKGEQWQQH